MEPLQLGKVNVTSLVELDLPTSPRFLFPEIQPRDFAPYARWLEPHFYSPLEDRLRIVIQAFIVRTPHHTIVVDTCVGNDKKRVNPHWNLMQGPFLQELKAAGVDPARVDYVMCTHLHVDHVGWNTRLVDGRWQPTFPNAKYVFNRTEYEYWSATQDAEQAETFRDSVAPILEAGRAVMIDGEYEIAEGVRVEPTPGHTPGHCSLHLGTPFRGSGGSGKGGEAVITGDMMHHPLQCLEPERCSRFAADPPLAVRTRRAFLERYAERDVRIVGTHFAPPTHGRVVRHQDAFRFEV